MGLVSVSMKAGYIAGESLVKVAKAKHIAVTDPKVAIMMWHSVVVTGKVIGAVVIGAIATHFAGF